MENPKKLDKEEIARLDRLERGKAVMAALAGRPVKPGESISTAELKKPLP